MSPSCRLCGEDVFSGLFVVNGHAIVRCRSCGFVQVAEPPDAEGLRRIYQASYFDKGKYVDDRSGRCEQQRRIHWLTRCGVTSGARVLDFGCATGEFLAMARETFDVWGTDLSTAAIDKARRNLPDLSQRLSIWQPPGDDLEQGFFDAIVLWDVVEHLKYPVGLLDHLVGGLRPGGVLALSTPDIGALTARLMGRRWHFMTPPEHLGFFDRNTISKLLAQAGVRETARRECGKWVNTGFLFYKFGRMFPEMVTPSAVERFRGSVLGGLNVYVPSGDIQYVAGVYEGTTPKVSP